MGGASRPPVVDILDDVFSIDMHTRTPARRCSPELNTPLSVVALHSLPNSLPHTSRQPPFPLGFLSLTQSREGAEVPGGEHPVVGVTGNDTRVENILE